MPDGNVTRPPNSGNRSAPTFADWQARSAALQLKRDGQELRGPCPSCGGTDRFSVGEREGRTLLQCRHCDPNGRTQGGKDAYRKIMEGAGFSGERSTATGRRRAPPKSPLERPPDGTYLEPFPRKDVVTLSTVLATAKIQMRYNLRAARVDIREPVIAADDGDWTAATDITMARIRDDIMRRYYVKTERGPVPLNFGRERWQDCVNGLIYYHQVDPFLEWLETLPPWNGASVIESILPGLFGAKDDELSHWAGRYLFVGAVERAYSPGCKLDEIPVLIGPQGIGKSALLSAILPQHMPELFGDGLRFDASPSHQVDAVLGKAVVEVSEMAGRSRADIEAIKAFVVRRNDNGVRRPYARYTEEQPRRFILAGTTNNENDLPNDPSGNRRFVPIKLGAPLGAVEDYIGALRETAWAEAMHRFRDLGESARLPRDLMPMQAERAEEHRDRDDRIEDAIEELPAGNLTLGEVLSQLPESLRTMSEHRVGRALKNAGWTSERVREGTKRRRLWSPP